MKSSNIQCLRRQIRQQRAGLSVDYRNYHQAHIHNLIFNYCSTHQRIGLYYAMGGEVDLRPLWPLLWQANKETYLPKTTLESPLLFHRFDQDSVLLPDLYEIPVPKTSNQILKPQALDLVIVPLIAIDSLGNRIGMGGGYYDRSFAFKKQIAITMPPFLLAVGWDFQYIKTTQFDMEDWDIPMNAFISESYHLKF